MADLNRDGAPDAITIGALLDYGIEGRVSLGNGDGTFQPPISFFGVENDAYSVGAFPADFNNDGLVDLLIGQSLLLQKSP